MRDSPETFCVLPFVQFDNELDGSSKPCCWSGESFGETRAAPILETWNSEKWRTLRRALVCGERPPECRACWESEAAGLESPRAANARIHGNLLDLRSFDPRTGEMRAPPRSLALKLSSTCNLMCRMCFPAISTSVRRIWDAELESITGCTDHVSHESLFDEATLLAELQRMGPHLHQVSFGGGEPFLQPVVLECLRALRPWSSQVQIHANTNLSSLEHLGATILSEMASFRQTILTASIDGFPDLHGYIRPGLDTARFLENLRSVRRTPRVRVDTNTAIQALNILYLPETLDFILRAVRPAFMVASLADARGCEYQDARTLPPRLKDAVTRKLAVFSSMLRPELYPGTPPSAVIDASRVLGQSLRFVTSRDLHTPEQWARFTAYHRKLDHLHGTRLRDVCPEIVAYLE